MENNIHIAIRRQILKSIKDITNFLAKFQYFREISVSNFFILKI